MNQRVHATEDIGTAETTKKQANELKGERMKSIKMHVQEHKELHDKVTKMERYIRDMTMCAQLYAMLETRTKPVPPPAPVTPKVSKNKYERF